MIHSLTEAFSAGTNFSNFENIKKCLHYTATIEWCLTAATKYFAKIVDVFCPLTTLVEKHHPRCLTES